MRPNTLIIFAKAPHVGRAKTRLGRHVGMSRAAILFRQMTQLTINAAIEAKARKPDMEIILAVDPPMAVGVQWPCWSQPNWSGQFTKIPQSHGDLGARITHAMTHRRHGPVVIIGTDAPQIRARHILEAFHTLGHSDAVFGPAYDGGYWLAGFARRRPNPALFQGVRWSSETTLQDTLNSIPEHHQVAMLEEMRDIDEKDDLDVLDKRALYKSYHTV